MDPQPRTAAADQRSLWQWIVDMPTWKKVAVGAALATVVVGGVTTLIAGDPAPAAGGADTTGPGGALAVGLLPDQPTGGTTGTAPAAEPAAKGVFRLGFSFVAGFCIGSFVRATLKVAAIAFGFWLVFTMALNYFGVLEVNWQGIDALWNRFAAAVEQEWSSFQTFMTGSLPAAGLAVTGLAVGLKRH